MSELAQKTASMLDMLPAKEQQLAYELLKRIVLAWDPDFTRVTPVEADGLEEAEAEIERGEPRFGRGHRLGCRMNILFSATITPPQINSML